MKWTISTHLESKKLESINLYWRVKIGCQQPYIRKTSVYAWLVWMHIKVGFSYVKTWIIIMHVNYIYDILMGLLSICGGMGLHVYIAHVKVWKGCEGGLPMV